MLRGSALCGSAQRAGLADGKEGARRREEEAGTARGEEEERAASLSFFAEHAAKQRGEPHASLISITARFQRARRQSNKEGLRGKSRATCKAGASAEVRGSRTTIERKDYQHLGRLRAGGGVSGSVGLLEVREVLVPAAPGAEQRIGTAASSAELVSGCCLGWREGAA